MDVLSQRIGYLVQPEDIYYFTEADDQDTPGAFSGNDKPSKYNPLYMVGRGIGYLTKRLDQGFSKAYGGTRNHYQAGYGKSKLADSEKVRHESAEESSLSLGVGLGKAYDDGNRLYNIGINQYHDSDASFVGDGEDPYTSRMNIPAIIAARMAGGSPDPKTISNGINKRSGLGAFKLRPLRDDLGPNG